MLHKNSEELINYFTKTKCLYNKPFNNLTKNLFLSFYVIYQEIQNNISYYYQLIIAGIIGITISIIAYQLSLFFLKGKVELKEEENAPEIRGLL